MAGNCHNSFLFVHSYGWDEVKLLKSAKTGPNKTAEQSKTGITPSHLDPTSLVNQGLIP